MTDTIKPEAGKRYVMRNGEVTGVLRISGKSIWLFRDSNYSWTVDGYALHKKQKLGRDLMAEYTEQKARAAIAKAKGEGA